jgi:2-polyprenyl-6-methoxyphenol hydroxylase-like FAD-dependent oxidoreductase
VLTAAVTDTDDVTAALRDYDAARRPRTQQLVRASAQVGRVGQWSNRGARHP